MDLTPQNLFICVIFSVLYVTESLSVNLTKYLDSQADIVTKILARESFENAPNIEFKSINDIQLPKNYILGEIIFLSDSATYVVLDQDLFKIGQSNDIELFYNFPGDDIKFAKTAKYNDMVLILIVTQSEAVSIYGYKQQEIFKVHNIKNENVSDALFFENNDHLYLFISNYITNSLAQTILYKFAETHFDEVETVLTAGALKIHSFQNGDSEIIIILQDSSLARVTSTVYQFNANEGLRKMQKFKTYKPLQILSYILENTRYISVYDVKREITTFIWTGYELRNWNEFSVTVDHITVIYYDERPFLLVTHNSSVKILKPSNNNKPIQLIAEYNMTDVGKIVDVKFSRHSEQLVILGIKRVVIANVAVDFTSQDIVDKNEIQITKCLSNMENKLNKMRGDLQILQKAPQPRQSEDPLQDMAFAFDSLNSRLSDVKISINNLNNTEPQLLIINGKTIMKNSITARKMITQDLNFGDLNKRKFQAKLLLSRSTPQRIESPVKIKNIITKVLRTNQNNDDLFKDVLLSKGNQNISGPVIAKNLKLSQLISASINKIPEKSIYRRSRPSTIIGRTVFGKLNITNAKIATVNGIKSSEVMRMATTPEMTKYHFSPNLTVGNLEVVNINNVNFDDLQKSVFKIGVSQKIQGNLRFSDLEVNKMNFETLARRRQVLSTSTDQVIESQIFINRLFTKNIQAHIINNIENFGKSVATVDGGLIRGPVSIDNVYIKQDLKMSDDQIDIDNILTNKEHIVGTNESDFIQRYLHTVKINGNLFLNDLNMIKLTNLKIGDQNFTTIDQYWSKSLDQVIPIHFEAQNGITTSHLTSKSINGVDIDDYMTNISKPQKHTKYYFENALINGNLNLNPNESHSPDINKIQKESVKINGTYHVKGTKVFKGNLKIEKLETNSLNKINYSNQRRISQNETMIVKGNFKSSVSTDSINGVQIPDLLENTLFVNENQSVSMNLNLKYVFAKNVHVKMLDNINMTNYLMKLNDVKNLTKIDNLYIKSSANFTGLKNVATINGIDISDLLNNSNMTHQHPIIDKIRFKGRANVHHLRVTVINNQNFTTLTRRVLYNKYNQTFKKGANFKRLKSKNLVSSKINNISCDNLVDSSKLEPQTISVPDGLTFAHLAVDTLKANLSCDLHEAINRLKNPKTQLWQTIIVAGNVTFWDTDSTIRQIFDRSITNASGRRTISSGVNFAKHITARNVYVNRNINDIDLQEIISDALLINYETEQFILGKKMFSHVSANDVTSTNNINVARVNKINITEVDGKLVPKNYNAQFVIRGKKLFFAGLQTKTLHTKLISNVNPDNIVSTGNLSTVPYALFESVNIYNNLRTSFVNNLDLNEFLSERLLINNNNGEPQITNATYSFHNLNIEGNMFTPVINDIALKNIIWDDQSIQNIESMKTFINGLSIIGDVLVGLVNGFKISESYQQAVIGETTKFEKNIRILKPSIINGNITTEYINNLPVSYMMETITNEPLKAKAEKIQEMVDKISKFVHEHFNETRHIPSEFMYLEKSSDIQISVPDTISAHVVETKDGVLIHIAGEESGQFCGLSELCKCPIQQIIQISGENSVHLLSEKGIQRVYTYADEEIVAHLTTSSMSTSSECRSNMTKVMNEVSYVTWNTVPTTINSGGFFMHNKYYTGYISGAEFFNVLGNTYLVLGRYYDPILNSHNLDCLVLRFNSDKTDLIEVQKIPTYSMWTMSLVHTAQGVILIIGSSNRNHFSKNLDTKIMRFNQHLEQFEMLREVPSFGALSAVGVVLGVDSLLILANEESTLQILKYQPDFDNYVFYQSFEMDCPIYAISVFYSGAFGISDAYLTVVTKNNKYYIYSFEFIEGWKLESSGEVDGIKSLIPFKLNHESYFFAPSSRMSSLISLVEHDTG